jgi:hypothetical protein
MKGLIADDSAVFVQSLLRAPSEISGFEIVACVRGRISSARPPRDVPEALNRALAKLHAAYHPGRGEAFRDVEVAGIGAKVADSTVKEPR